MDVREKLTEIIAHTPCVAVSSRTAAAHIADNLISHGVTVQVHARWLYMGKSDGKKIYSCTNCESLVHGAGDFCKVCGAKMDLPQINQRTAEALEEIGRQAHKEAPCR